MQFSSLKLDSHNEFKKVTVSLKKQSGRSGGGLWESNGVVSHWPHIRPFEDQRFEDRRLAEQRVRSLCKVVGDHR